jgi:superfamily II DNA or RNA helicase
MITLTVSKTCRIYQFSALPKRVLDALHTRFTFANPAFSDLERLGKWTGRTPRELCFLAVSDNQVAIPRGATRQALNILDAHGVEYRLDDRRRTLPEVNFTFTGKLRPYQQEAVASILARDFGTLSAPTGSGKTCMALHVIAERQQPALIVVHTKELMEQWVDRIMSFLGLSGHEIGRIGSGKQTIGKHITVALVQSLYKCAADVARSIGFLVVDECHRAPSRIFTEAVTAFDCRYMLGLSATPYRRDGLSRLIYWHLGDVVHQIKAEDLQESGDILKAEVITRETNFIPSVDPSTHYSMMISELTRDRQRNTMIARDVAREVRGCTGVCLVLSDRKSHLHTLHDMLKHRDINTHILTGDMPTKERADVVDALNNGQVKALLATGQLIGEGFDCRELSTLVLASPIRFSGRVRQYLGRILRPATGKTARVIDYVDARCGVLANAARHRAKVYQDAA